MERGRTDEQNHPQRIIIIIIVIIIIIIIYSLAPVLENDSHKLLWDFNIQTDHLIPARRPDLITINKKKKKKKENLQNSRLCCPGRPQNKTERMWKEG